MTNRTCSFQGCTKPYLAKSLCAGHYTQSKQGRELRPLAKRALSVSDRFASKVDKSGPAVPGHPELGQCWQWVGTKRTWPGATTIYGGFKVKDQTHAAHRFSYEMHNGPIPEGHLVDHVCHNTLCVKPGHLRLATKSQNNSYLKGAKSNNLSTGVRNVYTSPRKGKPGWLVYVKKQYGGVYDSIEEAEVAAKAMRAKLFDFPDF